MRTLPHVHSKNAHTFRQKSKKPTYDTNGWTNNKQDMAGTETGGMQEDMQGTKQTGDSM